MSFILFCLQIMEVKDMKTFEEILSMVIANYKRYFMRGIYQTPPETLDVFEERILHHFNSKEINESNFLLTADGKAAYITYNMDCYCLLELWYDEELSSPHSDEQKIENLLDHLIGCSDE